MDYFINNDILMQIEEGWNEKKEHVYYIITFFRNTHKVHKSDELKNYKLVKEFYKEILKQII